MFHNNLVGIVTLQRRWWRRKKWPKNTWC